MRTNLCLENIGRLIEGRHENPFELLGPHEVNDAGRRALAVRAFLPNSTQGIEYNTTQRPEFHLNLARSNA